jgi:two-component system alkaline phosphatase synthesis response regulator PhoP
MSGNRVLIVDDNRSIRAMVSDFLVSKGYEVIEAIDGIQGLDKALTSSPDVVLLDVVMPGIDGFKLCELLREKEFKGPIIMLTEKQSIEDKVTGFSAGADDYLGKPFSPVELELRIQALARRAAGDGKTTGRKTIKRGGLEIDLEGHTVTVDDKSVLLTPLEFNILKVLASTPGYVYSRQDLLSVIWDTEYEGYKRNIDPHVNRLRTKLEADPRKPTYILTVWGVGYKFNESLQ